MGTKKNILIAGGPFTARDGEIFPDLGIPPEINFIKL